MTQDDDPKRLSDWELDQLRYTAEMSDDRIVQVSRKDFGRLLDEVADYRRRYTHPYVPLALFVPIAGAVVWLLTGDWEWAVFGLLVLLGVAAVGASGDGAKRKRGDR